METALCCEEVTSSVCKEQDEFLPIPFEIDQGLDDDELAYLRPRGIREWDGGLSLGFSIGLHALLAVCAVVLPILIPAHRPVDVSPIKVNLVFQVEPVEDQGGLESGAEGMEGSFGVLPYASSEAAVPTVSDPVENPPIETPRSTVVEKQARARSTVVRTQPKRRSVRLVQPERHDLPQEKATSTIDVDSGVESPTETAADAQQSVVQEPAAFGDQSASGQAGCTLSQGSSEGGVAGGGPLAGAAGPGDSPNHGLPGGRGSKSGGFTLKQVDQPPAPIRKVEPEFPLMARQLGISGRVMVKFLVKVDGCVEKAAVVEADPKGIFEQSALDAVDRWKFKPGRYRGEAVATWVVLPIQFRLIR